MLGLVAFIGTSFLWIGKIFMVWFFFCVYPPKKTAKDWKHENREEEAIRIDTIGVTEYPLNEEPLLIRRQQEEPLLIRRQQEESPEYMEISAPSEELQADPTSVDDFFNYLIESINYISQKEVTISNSTTEEELTEQLNSDFVEPELPLIVAFLFEKAGQFRQMSPKARIAEFFCSNWNTNFKVRLI